MVDANNLPPNSGADDLPPAEAPPSAPVKPALMATNGDQKNPLLPRAVKAAAMQPNPSHQKPPPPKTSSTNAAAFAGGSLMTVVVRNEFYRDGFRNMLRIAIAESVIIVVLLFALIAYINSSKPEDHYFATTVDGRIMQLVPLNLANMGTSSLMSWAAQSATEVMTFGFHDYQRRMQQSSRHFTRRGWESFTNALQKSRIIESVESSQQVVTAQPSSAPILIQEGVFNGKYRWVVDLPLTVTYQAGTGTRTDNLTVRLIIDRVPSLENPNGVGIEQWIATQS